MKLERERERERERWSEEDGKSNIQRVVLVTDGQEEEKYRHIEEQSEQQATCRWYTEEQKGDNQKRILLDLM